MMFNIKTLNKSLKLRGLSTAVQTNMENFWMPFTNNRYFKANPKLFSRSEGIHYYTEDGKQVIDGMSGLWCCNAGHGQPKIIEAVKTQLDKMAFAPSFQTGHHTAFEFAQRLLGLLPGRNYNQVFFTMCGSTSVDTSLKIALAYHKARGESNRVRFIGRERGYHGVGFGGISVGGISPNRKAFSSSLLPFVDHLPHTHSLPNMAFSKGLPTWGAHLAESLESIVNLHDPSTIAAVIMEPVSGSTGVLPPPVGYLKKIREICDKYGILLIFDEVITGFGRTGKSFGVEKFDVEADMLCCAKGLTNAVVPAGAVISHKKIYDEMMSASNKEGSTIELFHGYTYSAHPLSMAAGIATLDVYDDLNLFNRANDMAPYFEELIHSMKGLPNVVDCRNIGMMGAVELKAMPGAPTKRASDIFDRCFNKGLLVRATGQTIALSPPLISEKKDLAQIVSILSEAIHESDKMCK